MEESVLDDYIDACELIRETEKEINKIRKAKRQTIVQSMVKGSMQEFPYAPQNFHVEGIEHSVIKNPGQLRMKEKILEERKKKAEELEVKVDEWLNTIPFRMQRIIRMKIFENEPWDTVAAKMGRNATANSVKMEYHRFIKDN
ncbi:hypothetical protein QE152_g40010 [Popillia japonica]|uniref:RNA polymerase subunit sigma-70 n=1 Tax=Popillia japonica TaxID=7064 RepID=A0AAW1HT97_POPJA